MDRPLNQYNLIGVSGKINSGKDLTAKIIQHLSVTDKNYFNIGNCIKFVHSKDTSSLEVKYTIKKFADTLKDIVCLLIGCTKEQLEDRDFKEQKLGKEWSKYLVSFPIKREYYANKDEAFDAIRGFPGSYNITKVRMTPRKLLQLLGTDIGRKIIHPNIWVNALIARYKTTSCWIVTDVRFPNEVQAIKDKGGVIIRLSRDTSCENNNHVSETALDNYKDWDYTIDNSGSVSELITKIKNIYYD